MIPKLTLVGSRYGAPFGRPTKMPETTAQRYYLVRVRFVDGDYDQGGAYWGGGPGTKPLYRWVTVDETGEGFVRASTRSEAKSKVRKACPGAKFFR